MYLNMAERPHHENMIVHTYYTILLQIGGPVEPSRVLILLLWSFVLRPQELLRYRSRHLETLIDSEWQSFIEYRC